LHREFLPEIDASYNSDTSDEETENTVGHINWKWYDDYDHIGYNRFGEKIQKPATLDEIDKFVQSVDDPKAW
jgi:ribosome biogenesis protein ERB1